MERRAAIETGQEQENVDLTSQISGKSIAVSKVMTVPELEALEAKLLAVYMEARSMYRDQGPRGNATRRGDGVRQRYRGYVQQRNLWPD